MPLLTEPEPPPRSRRGRWFGLLVLLALAVGAGYVLLPRFQTPSGDGERAAEAPSPARPAPAAPSAPAREPAVDPAPAPAAAPEPEARPSPAPAAPEPAAAPRPAVVLRVTSDVEGAEVFIDRRYAGTTPFESHEVEPGRRRINVSAPGYEGHAEDVEITGALTTVDVRFRQVRLDRRIFVVHRHRFGDCKGHLAATPRGIAYETDGGDAFEVGFDRLEEFAVDYLAHNLRLKVRGGRTYNFTDDEQNADALFVFHRAVEEARERLARGEPPAAP